MAKPSEEEPTTKEDGEGFAMSTEERGDVRHLRPPRPVVLHETIRREGEQELERSVSALGWSSLAAGMTMGFSMLARALLHHHVQGLPGAFLIESLGYPFGFLVVILARQQLFTENTMTAVLPLMTEPGWGKLGCLLRLWGVVFLGNVVGGALFAWGMLNMQLFDASTQASLHAMGTALMHNTPWQMFTKGIAAGWLIATMVWLLPAAERGKIAVIIIVTYVIALGDFTHIIVGSVEVMYLVFEGTVSAGDYATRFALPTLAGNIVGGSLIFALISHAQVRSDDENDEEQHAGH
ncbi:formate/nitrite transporter family protein [Dyella sp.]|uniref:formate/nitrite transporter family protein n=1 Tax=Dyella sp. TaxID=1869338 RepID=UPI002D792F50|nr:formate/nitrite transporter family protein [Dyella sp.]HET6433178.1 formate/nitrite transporter family protein [Dyella sp.]